MGHTDANICSIVFTFCRTIISQLVGSVSQMFYEFEKIYRFLEQFLIAIYSPFVAKSQS